jgi:hypothetical protein
VVRKYPDGGGEQVGGWPRRFVGGMVDGDGGRRRDRGRVTELHADHLAVLVDHANWGFANTVVVRDGQVGELHATILSLTSKGDSMDFTRLEIKDILSNVNKVNVDPDVLAKLMIGANTTQRGGSPYPVKVVDSQYLLEDTPVPPYVPVVYTEVELAKIKIPDPTAPGGFRTATQADVDEVNRVKLEAHQREWAIRSTYKANLNERDVVNAAFDAPERPSGFNPQFERVAVGEKNAAGDVCYATDVYDGESIFKCGTGHGYKLSRSLRSCPQCFLAGGGVEREDPGAVAGADGRW